MDSAGPARPPHAAEVVEHVDVAAIAARAQAARRQAGGPGPVGDAAYRATVAEALRTYPAPFAQAVRRVLTGQPTATGSVPEVDVDALREQYAQNEADHDRNPTETGFVQWLARRALSAGGAVLPDGRGPQRPKIRVDVDGDYGMSPEQARTLAAELLRLASLADATPQRAALCNAVDTKDGAR